MKFSKQRQLILDAVLQSESHPTAEIIYDTLKKDNPSLSLGTVYRNLSQLETNGLIRKVKIIDHPDRYDGIVSDHAHFVCRECGKVIDIESPEVIKLQEKVAEEIDGIVEDATVILYGRCNQCK